MDGLHRRSAVLVCLLIALAGCETTDPGRGIQVAIRDLTPGDGAVAEGRLIVTVAYVGMLASTGEVFDDTDDDGPISFQLETGLVAGDPQERRVIDGFTQGVPGMRVGGLRRITVPPQLAWGTRGAGCNNPEDPSDCIIPPNATLLFDVTLLAVREPE